MLGMDEATRFGELEFTLAPGDFMMVCSDGMLEAPCKDGKQFGVEGMERFFAHYSGNTPLTDLLSDIQRRSTFSPLGDDVSAIMVSPE
jgi:serine phosphatase RsbU (regulator of sigma subunit)